ncbi:MAG: glutamine-hydrolyzing carbamoyl-phosphate synthase small subunit, partial [Pseudomonadota bacterium]
SQASRGFAPQATDRPTGALVLADGSVFEGTGLGATGEAVGEVCFNTAITGYQEILTDPSYAEQIVAFTFPHIGNVGTNDEDVENASLPAATAARGAIMRAGVTTPSNYRARLDLGAWLRRRGIVGLSGVDTRALTAHIREHGMQSGVVVHEPHRTIDRDALVEKARVWPGIAGADLAKAVTATASFSNSQAGWAGDGGYEELSAPVGRVAVIDFGVKKNILRRLAAAGLEARVVPATAGVDDILEGGVSGVVLANGPGDPAATAEYAAPVIRALIEREVPLFGICLGHQLLALAVGAKTVKMAQGHHGANHPVKDLATGKVEIVSMNHGFCVDRESLPANVEETHVSLFDGTNCGVRLKDAPAFSVQHHPEASPGPQDSFGVFDRFAKTVAG